MTPYYDEAGITIYHGDAMDVLPSLCRVADAVVTDPPFKLSQTYTTSVDPDNLLAVSGVWVVAGQCAAATVPGGMAAVFYDNRVLPLGLEAFRRGGWKYLRSLTLYRRWGAASKYAGWMTTSDFVLIFANPGAKWATNGRCYHDVFVKAGPESESYDHPAQKPVEFTRQIVEILTPENGLVLDPYMGSGSTLAAAKLAGRQAIGVETEERYCEISAQRLSQCVLDFEGAA